MASFSWDINTLDPKLNAALAKANAYLSKTATYHALRAEAYAKKTAPWTDRTTNARGGLTATSSRSGQTFQIDVFHTMPYGFWLEVRWAGRYAVIKPTVDHEAPEFFKDAQEVFNRMFS